MNSENDKHYVDHNGSILWESYHPGADFRGSALSMDGTFYTVGHGQLYAFGD